MSTNSDRKNVTSLEFLGEDKIATGFEFNDTEVGGLSGITYDPNKNLYYAISDDRSQQDQARFYSLNINLSDNKLNQGDVTISNNTTILDENGKPFAENAIDAEGIAFLGSSDSLFISSEGLVRPEQGAAGIKDPTIAEYSLSGNQLKELSIPEKFLPEIEDTNKNGVIDAGDKILSGVRNNLAFESLSVTPSGKYLYTATENALVQDGAISSLEDESPSRIIKYDLTTSKPIGEFLYYTDTIPTAPKPPEGFADNGLVELIALDDSGTVLALERSFADGVGNNLRLYEVLLQGNTDISGIEALNDGEVDAVAQKRLIQDFSELGITLDNFEGMTIGASLPDGRQSLIVVSDNNFNQEQTTKFLAFALETKTTPSVTAKVETPAEIRYGDPNNPDEEYSPDLDDPAIYIHPTDPEQSIVIGSLKDEGLGVYDLEGKELQKISPDKIRYNNTDLVYGFPLGEEKVDLAIASDRENDTLVIFQIDPTTRKLTDITAPTILESIFGVDDGSLTAYGLASYTSPTSGKSYVFVSQRNNNKIAQLELKDDGSGKVNGEVVRVITVPVDESIEAEDAQIEGMVVDRELGYLYAAQEQFGIWKFPAEPEAGNTGVIVDTVNDFKADDERRLEADAEGLTIYYGADGKGYLIASSQGDSTFNIYDRQGSNSYLGSFSIGDSSSIDGVEESDGSDIVNTPLGANFPEGLLVVHDGSNEPAVVFPDPDGGEIQNFNTNFKYVSLEELSDLINLEPDSFDPRNPKPQTLINGIASGDTTQDSTVLWGRSTMTGEIEFTYSTDADFINNVKSDKKTITDINLPVKTEITGLEPGTTYYYQVTDAAGSTATGKFKTPALDSQTGLNFGVSGDWRGELAPYPAISNVADLDLDFFVEHGDTIYADVPSDAVKNADGSRKEQAQTLEEYRAKHGEVYGDRLGLNTWKDLRASTSILATIDDHEVINDFSGGAPVETDKRFPETTGLINDTQLYENGLQAFQEYNPLRDEFYGETGDDRTSGERKLYRNNTYGKDAAVFVLDNRSFRDEELKPADVSDQADVARFLGESLTLDRTMLGKAQIEEFKEDLLEAQNQGQTWKFIMVPEPIQNLGAAFAQDRFEGYAKERTEILSFIKENKIDNVVFISADIHGTVVNNLTYQETLGGEQIATGAWEITTGSVAYNLPLGPEVINQAVGLGLLNSEQKAIYDSLPKANDSNSEVDDKDDFFKQVINQGLTPLGYDLVGLNENIPAANNLIDATLLEGDYVAAHTFGWTEFNIDPDTQELTVRTYGVEPYSEEKLLDSPEEVINQTPEVVSEFVVKPQGEIDEPSSLEVYGTTGDDILEIGITPDFTGESNLVFAGAGKDLIDVTESNGGNRIYGDGGNDRFILGTNDRLLGGKGADKFFVGSGGDNLITGNAGKDQFWIATAEYPESANTITDFQLGTDVIGVAGLGLSFSKLTLTQEGSNTIIAGPQGDLAILFGVVSSSLTEGNFKFA